MNSSDDARKGERHAKSNESYGKYAHHEERLGRRLVSVEVADETRAAPPRAQLGVRQQRAPYRRRHELL